MERRLRFCNVVLFVYSFPTERTDEVPKWGVLEINHVQSILKISTNNKSGR